MYEKVQRGVSFSFFRLSKIEKRRVSPILDSLKFHSKGPVRLQTGTDHSFLGFEFKLSWTHPKDELIIKQMLSSSSLSKIKRYLPEMVGEKREKWACLSYFVTTLEHDTFIHLGWEILCLTVDQTTLKVFSRFLGINFGSIVTKPSVVSLCVQEVTANKPFICKISVIHLDHPWVSPCN